MTTKVLDVDEVIRRHAWALLVKQSNFIRRKFFLDEADFKCEPDWDSLTLDHHVSKFEIRPAERTYTTDWGSVRTGARWAALHGCEFENRSNAKQRHVFKCSRETTAWVAACLEQTWSVDQAVHVALALPAPFAAVLGDRHSPVQITKLKGDVMSETLSWEANSQVEVMPSRLARAELLARQESHMVDFEVRTTLSLPHGAFKVNFRKPADEKPSHTVVITDLEACFKPVAEGGGLQKGDEGVVHRLIEARLDEKGSPSSSASIQLVTRGILACVSWSDQKVDIKTTILSQAYLGSEGEDGGQADDDGDVQTETTEIIETTLTTLESGEVVQTVKTLSNGVTDGEVHANVEEEVEEDEAVSTDVFTIEHPPVITEHSDVQQIVQAAV